MRLEFPSSDSATRFPCLPLPGQIIALLVCVIASTIPFIFSFSCLLLVPFICIYLLLLPLFSCHQPPPKIKGRGRKDWVGSGGTWQKYFSYYNTIRHKCTTYVAEWVICKGERRKRAAMAGEGSINHKITCYTRPGIPLYADPSPSCPFSLLSSEAAALLLSSP